MILGLQVRSMALEDVEAVIALAAGLPTAPHWPRAAWEALFDPVTSSRRIALVAELQKQVIGFAIAALISPEAELESIAVMQSHQGGGVGRTLLAELQRQLQSRGISEITLEVRASNIAALRFYQAHGFTEIGRRPGYYPDSGEAAVLMTAPIPTPARKQ
ncbi:ribosomal-protein-alanine N-acetyltransferase [Acidobacteria bacterium AB60]|nr:ribosomal-protein-alanine N-acetyltransferase [Acidobacteria bacterium AB60]